MAITAFVYANGKTCSYNYNIERDLMNVVSIDVVSPK